LDARHQAASAKATVRIPQKMHTNIEKVYARVGRFFLQILRTKRSAERPTCTRSVPVRSASVDGPSEFFKGITPAGLLDPLNPLECPAKAPEQLKPQEALLKKENDGV